MPDVTIKATSKNKINAKWKILKKKKKKMKNIIKYKLFSNQGPELDPN